MFPDRPPCQVPLPRRPLLPRTPPGPTGGGNQSATPAFTVRPRNEQEALDAVRFAIREGLPVRAVGSGHSSSPLVQTGGVLMDMAGLSAITGTDQLGRRARALAGTTINAFGDALWEKGLALSNQGDIDKQQIAGALATSTHGSGKDLGSFSSKLRWVKLINGYGEIVEIGEGQLRELRAAQTALGTLGGSSWKWSWRLRTATTFRNRSPIPRG